MFFGTDGFKTVWHRNGEEYKEKCMVPTVKHGDGSVLMWGCMSTAGVRELLLSHHGEVCPVLGFCLVNFMFYFENNSFQITCPSSCVPGLTSSLILDCFHLCSPPRCI